MNVNPLNLLKQGIDEISKDNHDLDKCEHIFNTLYSYYDMGEYQTDVIANLATIHMLKENFGQAINLFNQLIENKESSQNTIATSYNNIGICERKKSFIVEDPKLIESARSAFKKSFELNPYDVGAKANEGCCYVAHGEPEKAIELLKECDGIYENSKNKHEKEKDETLEKINKEIELCKDDKKKEKLKKQIENVNDKYQNLVKSLDKNIENAKWNLGLAYLEINDFKNGWDYYEYGKRTENRNARTYGNIPKWEGENGKTIIVYGEQGIGDEIMWASMIPELLEKNKVIIDCHPRLQHLFMESFPEATVYGTRKEEACYWTKRHKIDAYISFGSLGRFLRQDVKDFPGKPYMEANEDISNKYKEKLNEISDKKKIGISWRAGTVGTGELYRKIDLQQWLPIFELEGYEFISLQYRPDAEQDIEEFNSAHPDIKIHHWRETLDDYDETAGLVENLDMVISVPQSVIHLAGALGKKSIQMCPKNALWQMGKYGGEMPWYDCVSNIWQSTRGKWDDVIEKATGELCKL